MWYIAGIESIGQSDRAAMAVAALITSDTFVIVDESTYIKGHKAKRTQRIIDYSRGCRYRLILTGTPMTQGIPDLFSQLYFLSPKILGYKSWHSFAANHLEYDPDRPGLLRRTHNTEYLAAKMRPYVYQVTKRDCLTLPAKLYKDCRCDLTTAQERAYQLAKDDFFERVEAEGGEVSSYAVFKLFTALQSIVCGFWTREGERLTYPHRRLDTLLEVIRQVPADAKIIIWAKYRNAVEEIAAALGDEAVRFYGGASHVERETALERFRDSARFLVATQASGSHGLTLNEAHYVIFYAQGYKYAERIQSEDRCHRIGQTEPVTYISIWSDTKIEERIASAIARKGDALKQFREEIDKIKREGIKEKVRELVNAL